MTRLRSTGGRPQHLAYVIAVPLALLAVALAVPIGLQSSFPVKDVPGFLLFFALFAVAQTIILHLEVRRQSVSLQLTEIPLLLGLFYLPAVPLILARVLSLILILLLQRYSAVKIFFNAAAVGLAITVASMIATLRPPGNGPGTWLVLALAVGATTVITIASVTGVISLVQGLPPMHDLIRTFVQATVVVAVNTIVGLIVLLVVAEDPWAILLLAGLGAMLLVAYRAYARSLLQHRSLTEVYDLARAMSSAGRDGTVPEVLLGRARQMLHVEYVTLWLPAHGRYPELLLSARDESSGLLDVSNTPPLLRQAATDTKSTIFVTTKTGPPEQRAALRAAGVKDAIIVPMRSGDAIIGTLEATGRLNDNAFLKPADVRLLETLAAQAAVAVENSRLVDRLQFDAYHDPLTSLPNRRRVLALLEEAVKVRAPGEVVAVLLVDIDGLRDVNDSLGHDAGDRMIIEVASRLRRFAPAAALVGRAASDEFVVTQRLADVDEAMALAVRIRDALQEPMQVDTITLDVDVAVGVAVHPDQGTDAEALLRAADLAVQSAKQYATPVQLYQASLQSRSSQRLGLAADMRRALESSEVEVYYQPKVALPDRRVVGVECLARWEHPTHGQVSPADFVAIAGHTGQLGRLTEIVLREGLRRAKGWLDEGRPLPIAVNLSARTLIDPTFPPTVARLLREYEVPSSLLTLEITEDGMVGEPDRPMSTLRRLNELGVRLAVDDFGTGYSSLSYLRRLPVDEVKIDRSFVQGMATDTGDLAIVRAVVDLARHFGLLVVAEGVESERTVNLLEGLGCDVGQGFLFSRPLPYERFEAWLSVQTEPVDGPASTSLTPDGILTEGRRLRAVP